jgi:hypothetical protein
VTFAKRPSEWDGMAMDIDSIWGGGEAEYFLNENWTGQITLNALRKLVFARRAFSTKTFVPKGRSIHISSPSRANQWRAIATNVRSPLDRSCRAPGR